MSEIKKGLGLEIKSPDDQTPKTNGFSGENERVKLDNLSLERRISYLISQPEVIEIIKSRGQEMLGIAIKFLILFPDNTEGLVAFLNEYDVHSSEELIASTIAKNLDLPEIASEESQRKIYDYFYDKFIQNGYYFHGFNGVFLPAIREHGLDPNERLWDWAEIDELKKILQNRTTKERDPIILFFGSLHMNCRGLISLADNTYSLPRYAIGSPEWFNIFTGHAFEKRDYEAAKSNVMGKMDQVIGLDVADQVRIMAFFDKHWSLFASGDSQPKCALIKRGEVFPGQVKSLLYQELKRLYGREDIYPWMKRIFSGIHYNEQTDQKIEFEHLKIVDLPNYSI